MFLEESKASTEGEREGEEIGRELVLIIYI